MKSWMIAQRATVSTEPSGVSAGLPVGAAYLPPRSAAAGRRGSAAAAGNVPPAKIADASRACRRVSIGTRLLFHDDLRIGYSGAQHLVQHQVGLLHGCD